MACQHTAQHHEIRAAAERFCDIARHGATAIADNHTAQTMRGIGAFNHRRKLRIAHAGFHTRGTYGARTNPDFYNIRAGENQLFTHFTGHHVTGTNGFSQPCFTRL